MRHLIVMTVLISFKAWAIATHPAPHENSLKTTQFRQEQRQEAPRENLKKMSKVEKQLLKEERQEEEYMDEGDEVFNKNFPEN